MRRALPWLAGLAIVAALTIGIAQGGGGAEEEPATDGPSVAEMQAQLAGAPAPLAALHERAATLETGGEGAYRRQLAALKGYPVVVNAWGSWCGPCRAEFPIFARVSTKLGKRVGFLGLNVVDNNEAAREFLAGHPVPYPSYEDGRGTITKGEGGIGGAPVTIFYDRDGERQFTHQGQYRSDADLERDIRRYAGA
jgi:cytochrome c biogenesis protein CcmG/thiol:disulfide interchange protein DsbE